ncbi:unnamed protein product [Nippostrongylus brasiliensis]|uniref:TIG_plexin domain-containing protein n=1 Tax=Nippostrongylus brasiliensis TaxID=27835 RepID=A0A0N4YIR1_NIPBR|nr:unnamed protein product [Nippostrongylus brasiliensis]
MRTSNCVEGAATCVACLAKRDPFCGCIRGVVPDKIQITTADFLNVSLENMGDTKGRLQCSFRFADGKVVNSEPAKQDPHDGCLESNECVAGKLTEDRCRKQHIVNGLNVGFSRFIIRTYE